MGIRFFCPNGHRVHVKAALAGKKGFCPDCGERVRIPHESDPAAIKKSPVNGAVAAAPAKAAHGDVAVSVAAPGAGSPKVDLFDSDSSVNGAIAANASGTKAPAPSKSNGANVADLLPPSKGRPKSPDAIDESPESGWYVRPNGGGQFGPAKGPVMRKWLGEGRVGADSLIWREGWSDWKTASEVFPGLPGDKPPEPTISISKKSDSESPAPLTGTIPAKPVMPGRPKGKSSMGPILLVVGLAVVCLGLAAALVFVMNR